MTDKLRQLLARCKCGVHLTVNQHRGYYQSVLDRLEDLDAMEGGRGGPQGVSNIPEDVRRRMIEADTIIELQFYPDTPNGFYLVLHHDLDEALDIALDGLRDDGIKLDRRFLT